MNSRHQKRFSWPPDIRPVLHDNHSGPNSRRGRLIRAVLHGSLMGVAPVEAVDARGRRVAWFPSFPASAFNISYPRIVAASHAADPADESAQ